jgi:polyhydroxyalkanoate synthase
MSTSTTFAVGDNLALSPGEVVFRNPVLELIQYSSTTDTVTNDRISSCRPR